MNITHDILTSRETIQMLGGQTLIWISQMMQGHINWVLASIATVLGLIGVILSIINAKKKGRVHDLEIRNLELENEKLEREKLLKINEN